MDLFLNMLVPLERSLDGRKLFLFCDDFGGVVHHLHWSEYLLVTLTYVGLIRSFCWVEFKCDWCGVFIVFEYDFCTVFDCSRDRIVVFIGGGVEID